MTEEMRYLAYCRWCESLNIEPASFDRWQHILRLLPG